MTFSKKVGTINLNAIQTKVNKQLLNDFVHLNDLDIVFCQEVHFEDFSFISSHKAFVNISCQNKGTAILIRKNQDFRNLIYDPSGRIVSIVCNDVNYVNVYAHSGSDKRKERDDLFRNSITPHVVKPGCSHTVIGGDFNCVLAKKDSRNSSANIGAGLKDMVSALQLKDAGQEKGCTGFTFHRCDSASRLDRFYVSRDFLDTILEVKNVAVAFSDHHAVVLKFEVDPQHLCRRGRGYWKLNPAFLKDDSISNRFLVEYEGLRARPVHLMNRSIWWNHVVKKKITWFYQEQGRLFNRRISSAKSTQYQKLNELAVDLGNGLDVRAEIAIVKSRLMEMECQRLQYLGNKLSGTSLIENEKMNIFHVSNQVHRLSASSSFKLLDNGALTDDQDRLKAIIQGFYSNCFMNDPLQADEGVVAEALGSVSKTLSVEQANQMLRPISEDELKSTSLAAAKKKSPGPDGLSYEFYLTHFDIVKEDLLKLFNGYLDGSLKPPKEFSAGIITLIPKEADAASLDKYRPISMLNTDYKLFTKILANRLHAVLGDLLGEGQSACLQSGSCAENLKKLRKVMLRTAESKRFKAFLLSTDLEKAFDKVNHKFLWRIMDKFGIPQAFIDCIKNLYEPATSRVIFNGFMTKEIVIGSSVRQGCPLSMALFVLYIEPLIRRIAENVQGVLMDNQFVRVIAYADDLAILVRNDAEFDLVLQIVNSYALSSCVKLNKQKSCFLRLNGAKCGPQQFREVTQLKILGVMFTERWKDIVNINYAKLVRDIKFRISLHRVRQLNLLERTWLLNVFILSKLWYVCQVFPPNNKHLAEIRKAVGAFLWQSQVFKCERNQLYLDLGKGGVCLVDHEAKAKALFQKNVLYGKDGEEKKDLSLLKFGKKDVLGRNTKDWLVEAEELGSSYTLNTVRLLYCYHVDQRRTVPKIEEKLTDLDWENLWNNLSHNFLTSDSRSTLFLLYNDLLLNKDKLHEYKIGRVADNICEICGKKDNNFHRLRECDASQDVWKWLKETVANRLKINCADPEDILAWKIQTNDQKQKAALWLVSFAVSFVLKKFPKGSLFELKKSISTIRWNNKLWFKAQFGKWLYVC